MRRSTLLAALTMTALSSTLATNALAADKAGRFSFSAKVGPAIDLDQTFTQTSVSAEFLIAADNDYNAYLGVNPQFQFAEYFMLINVPATFQYDIELPVDGLYIFPKLSGGISYLVQAGRIFGQVEPALGVKYQAHEYVHVTVEPLSFPLYIGRYFAAQYHIYIGAGVDF